MQISRAVCKKNGAGRERGQSGPAGDVCGKQERSRQGTGGRCVCARQKFSDGWWVRAEGSSAGNRKNNGWRTRCIGGAKEKQRKGTAAEPSAEKNASPTGNEEKTRRRQMNCRTRRTGCTDWKQRKEMTAALSTGNGKNAPPADGLRGGAEGKAGERTGAVSSALFSAEEPLQ